MAVGSSDQWHVKAELYNFGTGAWKLVDDYPFATFAVYTYEIIFISEKNSFFVIGGSTGKYGKDQVSHIAKLANGVWSSAGNLKSVRAVSYFFVTKLVLQF